MNCILERFEKYDISYSNGVLLIRKAIKVYDFMLLKRELKRMGIVLKDIIVGEI